MEQLLTRVNYIEKCFFMMLDMFLVKALLKRVKESIAVASAS